MYATQFLAGTAVLTVALQVVGSTLLPSAPPIIVNGLAFEDGNVTQERMVPGTSAISAVWNAKVIDAVSGLPVDGCTGHGGWDYSPGPKIVTMPLNEWVGAQSCRLLPGTYQLFAEYKVGSWSTDARSDIFEVPE